MNVLHNMQAGSTMKRGSAEMYLARSGILILASAVLLFWLAGGFPPTVWKVFLQTCASFNALWAVQGSTLLFPLALLLVQSLLVTAAWLWLLWLAVREAHIFLLLRKNTRSVTATYVPPQASSESIQVTPPPTSHIPQPARAVSSEVSPYSSPYPTKQQQNALSVQRLPTPVQPIQPVRETHVALPSVQAGYTEASQPQPVFGLISDLIARQQDFPLLPGPTSSRNAEQAPVALPSHQNARANVPATGQPPSAFEQTQAMVFEDIPTRPPVRAKQESFAPELQIPFLEEDREKTLQGKRYVDAAQLPETPLPYHALEEEERRRAQLEQEKTILEPLPLPPLSESTDDKTLKRFS